MQRLGFTGVVSALALSAVICVGCGEPFLAGSGGAGGGPTTTTTTTGGGAGGEGGMIAGGGGSGGMTSGGGQGGGGCTPGDAATCPAGEYCVASTLECAPCAVLGGVLQFAAAQPLGIQGPAANPSFPRSRQNGAAEEMVFVVQGESGGGSDTDLAVATRSGGSWSAGQFVAGDVINTASPESAPLYLPESVQIQGLPSAAGRILFGGYNNMRRQIFAAAPDSPSRSQVPGVNDSIYDTYSFAVAYEASPMRYWYMRKVGASFAPKLVTQLPGQNYTIVPDIKLPGGMCNVNLDAMVDIAPWVTPKGDFLLFHADWSASCGGGGDRRGFYVEVDPATGSPKGNAQELSITGLPDDADVRTPALSGDLCSVYFASSYEGTPQLYGARRQ